MWSSDLKLIIYICHVNSKLNIFYEYKCSFDVEGPSESGCNFLTYRAFSSHNISSPVTLDLCCFLCDFLCWDTVTVFCTYVFVFVKKIIFIFTIFVDKLLDFDCIFLFIYYTIYLPPLSPPPTSNYVTWKGKESWHKKQHRVL